MRDLQSLCDRLNEVFNADDDTPDELCQEAREAIEELWEQRDAPKDELGWLIEAARTDGPQRYRVIEQGMPSWTTDPNKAIRFARRVDAEMYCAEDEDAWHVVEHMWPAVGKTATNTGESK